VSAGTLVLSAPNAIPADAVGNDPQGRLIFSRDGIHPTDAGHRLYTERLIPILSKFIRAGTLRPHSLPEPLRTDHWQRARLITVNETHHGVQWRQLPQGAPQLTAQKGTDLEPPTWVAFEPGAAVEFRFKGTAVGLIGLKGPDNGEFRVTVDDLSPETGTLFDSYSTPGRYLLKPWFYPNSLSDAEHRVRLELLSTVIDKAAIMAKAGTPITDSRPFAAHGLYLSGFLVVGEMINPAPDQSTTAGK